MSLQPTTPVTTTTTIKNLQLQQPLQSIFHHPLKKRTTTKRPHLVIRCSNNNNINNNINQFNSFLSQLNLLTPALGFTTAIALINKYKSKKLNDIGDWTLFTSPTPFNRFIKLRCGSLLLRDSNETLVGTEGVDTGRMYVNESNEFVGDHEQVVYQRMCLSMDDGGVVSLDWPAHLEMTLEQGLDTTILIVPGTTNGSMDENVRSFVYECLTRGCFPIVMNPRGCARSPLTTPRLFTAADSDDICTAVQFINRARPWTTFMGVGFGYGANMLTKYLAEVGEETPLTAATCLDNPFDLEGAANHRYVNHNLTSGLIDMLQSNKELFLGRSKRFDVEKALQAKSLKDFEEAISMVSYGFDSIEEFYASSSTRNVVGNVKVPLLFIQNSAMASFFIPHNLISENPFTSLLNCNFQSDEENSTGTFDVSWCRHLVVEWLTAVELGLLKGRHPLLEDTDVAITPSKRMTSNKLKQLNGDTIYPLKKMLKGSNNYVNENSDLDLQTSIAKDEDSTNRTATQREVVDLKEDDVDVEGGKVLKATEGDLKEGDVDVKEGKAPKAAEGDLEEGDVDTEEGKVLKATEVVMNLVDAKMPEALTQEQKLKVLTAVGRGESVMTALQDAVPEDVRGKLTSSVTAILENKEKIFSGLTRVPDGASALTKKMQDVSAGLSSVDKETNASELSTNLTEEASSKNDTSKSTDQSGSNDSPKEKPAPSHDSDSSVKPDVSKKTERSEDNISDQVNSGKEAAATQKKEKETVTTDVSEPAGTEKTSASSADKEKETVTTQKKEKETVPTEVPDPSGTEKTSASSSDTEKETVTTPKKEESSAQSGPNSTGDQVNSGLEGEKNVKDNQKQEASEPSTDVSKPPVAEKTSVSSTDTETETVATPKSEELSEPPAPSSNSPSFNASQAFGALTGMDDSTQLAVNSVFSVIENVITQMEAESDDESTVGDDSKASADSESRSAATPPPPPPPPSPKGGDEKSSTTTELKEVSNHQQHVSISSKKKNEAKTNPDDVQRSITKLPNRNSLNDHYDQSHLDLKKKKNDKSLQADDLHLDYIPEEDQWKLLEQSEDHINSVNDVECNNDIVEPAYVILDGEGDWDPVGEDKEEKLEIGNVASVKLWKFVKGNILKSLEVEVSRRIKATDMTDIELVLKTELENIANTVSLAVIRDKQHVISWDGERLVGIRNLQDELVLDAISSAVQDTKYLKKVIPVGIVVGSTLASLRKIINVNIEDSSIQISDADEMAFNKFAQKNDLYNEDEEQDVSSSLSSDNVMVGAVTAATAALGASAYLVHQNSYSDGFESSATSSMSLNQKENDKSHQELGKFEDESSKSGDSMVTSLAEKAMQVAGPVMPTNEDGGVDQDRLVQILADLGQRGGILRLVGKVALLWGGIRGAMSLIGKLISFLRLSERSLIQRILGFVFMVLVLWTPVVVPLLPTLVQNLATHNSSPFAELACIIGLYGSIAMLIVLWGERIRGYENPLGRYGLELTAKQFQNFLYGLIGGVTLVFLIQYTNVLLGFVSLSWPTVPSSPDTVTLLKLSGKVLTFVGHGLVTTVAVAFVEELLFRSWLPEEIAVDLGYNRAIILSGLAFSLSQWSLKAIPGVWLLSLGLAGVRQRCQGRLSLPIGLRAGIMASSFFLKQGGFLTYQQHNTTAYPLWISGSGDPFQPFNSIVGLAVALLWAAALYPRNTQNAVEPELLKENINE